MIRLNPWQLDNSVFVPRLAGSYLEPLARSIFHADRWFWAEVHRSQKLGQPFHNRAIHVHPCADGAGEGTRTLNLRITNPVLYQLSYASMETNGRRI